MFMRVDTYRFWVSKPHTFVSFGFHLWISVTRITDDGIYEFFQTIDVFGNIISNLPVLGPIRNKIRDDLKAQLACD